MDERRDGWMSGQSKGGIDGRAYGWRDRETNKYIDGGTDGWGLLTSPTFFSPTASSPMHQ